MFNSSAFCNFILRGDKGQVQQLTRLKNQQASEKDLEETAVNSRHFEYRYGENKDQIKTKCRFGHAKKPANGVFTGFVFKQITGVEERG